MEVPWEKTLIFLSPLGPLKLLDFLSFLLFLKLSYSKPFYNNLDYASTANIEEVMKFYNLGAKTFETSFRSSTLCTFAGAILPGLLNDRPAVTSSSHFREIAGRKGILLIVFKNLQC